MNRPIIGITGNTQANPDALDLVQAYTAQGYVEGVQKAGGLPFIIPINQPELASSYLATIDKLILTGGQHVAPQFYGQEQSIDSHDYNVKRDEFELALIKEAMRLKKPIFSVCRGTQLLNVALGGTLFQDISDHWQELSASHPAHHIDLLANTPLSKIFGPHPKVNSFHRQAIKDLAPTLEAIGFSSRDQVIEAVRSANGYPLLGVQWHPEFMIDHRDEDLQLFDYIVNQL